MDTFTVKATDQKNLPCYLWPRENEKAVVLIIHGLAEHAIRYRRFAEALNKAGYSVVATDLRGHGKGCETLGYIAKRKGWEIVVDDIQQIIAHIKEQYPDKPIILFGHSMGSIFARAMIQRHGEDYVACVLSGVTLSKPGMRDVAPAMTSLLGIFGANRPSKLLNKLSFGSFNDAFKPSRTEFDWLSRDEKEVDKYVEDEHCGFVASPSLFKDISVMLLDTLKDERVKAIPSALPIFIVSGEKDPCGCDGLDAKLLHEAYTGVGCKVKYKIYEGARHELLNETNRDEVTSDIIEYLEECV